MWTIPFVLIYVTVCAVYDARTWQVPNWLTLPALFLALAYRELCDPSTWLPAAAGLIFIVATWDAQFFRGGDAKVLMALWAVWPDPSFTVVLCATFPIYYLVSLLPRVASAATGRRLFRSTSSFPALIPTALGVWVYSFSMLFATVKLFS
jgi:Flp pilus assembly protein protease CpaA